jgi:hypothetical protein
MTLGVRQINPVASVGQPGIVPFRTQIHRPGCNSLQLVTHFVTSLRDWLAFVTRKSIEFGTVCSKNPPVFWD